MPTCVIETTAYNANGEDSSNYSRIYKVQIDATGQSAGSYSVFATGDSQSWEVPVSTKSELLVNGSSVLDATVSIEHKGMSSCQVLKANVFISKEIIL
jgi:hypothetical protein